LESQTRRRFKLSHLVPGWLVLFTLGHFSHHLLTALPVPLLPFIRDSFSLDYTLSGLLLSVFSITYGLSQLPSGWLADRLGSRILMTAGICGVGLCGILIGLTPGYVMLLILMGLMGLLGGGYHPSAPPLVSSTVAPRERGRAIGVHAIGGSASYFIAPLIAAATAAAWGWRSSFLILAAPTLGFGILLYFMLSRLKSRQPVTNTSDGCAIVPRKARDRRELTAFMALSSAATIVITSVVSFIPLLLVDHLSMSQESAALIITVIYFTGIFANPLAGFISDRVGRIPLLVFACLALVPVLYLMTVMGSGWAVDSLLVAIGIIIALTQTSSESHIVGSVAEDKCSSVLGVYYFINMTGAGIVTPALGALIDNRGIHFSLTLTAIIMAAATLAYCSWLLRRRRLKTA